MISLNYTKKNITTTPYDDLNKSENIMYEIKNNLDNNDIFLLSKLNILRLSLSGDNLNLKNIKEEIKEFTKFNNVQRYEYLNNLLRPEKARGSKIPSQVPVPSCSFQLHNCITISTNSAGNCAFIMNPCFLASNTLLGSKLADDSFYVHKFLSSAWVNNDDSLIGNTINDKWIPVDFGQVLPPVYNQYRLVSASLVIKYIGRLDAASGVLGGSIILDDINTVGGYTQPGNGDYDPDAAGTPSIDPDLNRYGNFELARDSFYHQDNSCLEGIRMLYFPIDNSYEEYTAITDMKNLGAANVNNAAYFQNPYKSGFNWMFYAQGAPASSNCFKVDLYCNFECLPDAEFLNYMPISAYPFAITTEERKRYIMIVQSRPILKLNEEPECNINEVPNLFMKMINKFKNGLPGFEKLRAWGLINSVPSLLPGITLANNMIANNISNNY